jgi:hypothetical protein
MILKKRKLNKFAELLIFSIFNTASKEIISGLAEQGMQADLSLISAIKTTSLELLRVVENATNAIITIHDKRYDEDEQSNYQITIVKDVESMDYAKKLEIVIDNSYSSFTVYDIHKSTGTRKNVYSFKPE